jgi:hypothetical protein
MFFQKLVFLLDAERYSTWLSPDLLTKNEASCTLHLRKFVQFAKIFHNINPVALDVCILSIWVFISWCSYWMLKGIQLGCIQLVKMKEAFTLTCSKVCKLY